MNNQTKNYCFLLVLLFISTLSFAQKQFHITIQFVPKLDTNNLVLWVDDGKGTGQFPARVKNGKVEINLPVYSKYVWLNMYSPSFKSQKSYFFTNEESSVIFFGKKKSEKDYPFVNGKLTNAVEIINSPEAKKLKLFVQKEQEDFDNFKSKNGTLLKSSDSLMSIYKQKEKTTEKKVLDFIRINSDQYFSFWLFNIQFKDSKTIPGDSLLRFYKDVLYPKYKDLFEGKKLLDYLLTNPYLRIQTGTNYYALNPLMKVNQMAPDFTTTDMMGKKFSLKQFRGKYVLINFWATWCGPCVRELPLFNKLRADFPVDQLEMISVSEDRAKADCINGIKEYGLNWTNVYQDKELIDKYDFENGIPKTFLIDKEGRLVFMFCGSLDNTEELRKFLLKK